MKAEYWRNYYGDKYYKINGNHVIEIDLESYDYGVIGLIYGDLRKIPIKCPPEQAVKLSKRVFNQYYKLALNNIKLAFKENKPDII